MANLVSPLFGSIIPSQKQEVLQSNYLQFTDKAGDNFSDFAQQYLPEIYEQEVERYGNRTLSGFLRMVGAEMPMTSDQVIWSEQNRLHIAYEGCTTGGAGTKTIDIPVTAAGVVPAVVNVISVGQTIVAMDDVGAEVKGIVSASNTNGTITVEPYDAVDLNALNAAGGAVKIFVYGSEYGKGSSTPNAVIGAGGAIDGVLSIEPSFTQFSNSPIIIRSKYTVNGSDMAQIGWVEVALSLIHI